jgi:hypothetical protein
MARMCPGNPSSKWEALPHGDNAFLVGIPTAEDLSRIDGMQMSVPKVNAQALVSSWVHQDVLPEFVMKPVWVHVDGVPDSVRHFLGLWAVGSLIGTTMDVDLFALRSQGLIRVLVAMRDPTVLEKDNGCLEVIALLQMNGYRFRFRREVEGYKADPRFRPFFWKDEEGDDGSHGFEEGFRDDTAEAARRQLIWMLMVRRLLTLLVFLRCRLLRWL